MRVARVNGIIDRNHVELHDEDYLDLAEAARLRCPACPNCGGRGYFERGEDPDGPDSGFCHDCRGRGFVNDDPRLDDSIVWVCHACGKEVNVRTGGAEDASFCWHCRMPYHGEEQEPVPLRTVCPITGDKLG